MATQQGFRLPRICLPRPGIDLRKWSVIACDQHTAEPAYWHAVEREVGDAPSTLHLIFPEAYLDQADAPERIARIQATMRRYLEQGLLEDHEGAIYVERSVDGRVRRGLMLELDLEHYDFSPGSTSLIRPTEGTIVDRLAPRIAVRRGAALELPHVLVLIDDPQGKVIEPIAAARDAFATRYDTELMLGGGRVAGRAVDPQHSAAAVRALDALADPQRFARRYGVAADTPVMLFAVGDGNHSLASAKSIWNELKPSVGIDHPSRFALVEVVNLHDPGIAFAPIHRLLIGVRVEIRKALADAFGHRLSLTDLPSAAAMRERLGAVAEARCAAGLIGPGPRCALIEIAGLPAARVVDTIQGFVDGLVERAGAAQIDYVHGDAALERLAAGTGRVGIHLPAVSKTELLRRVVNEGPLPRKTFSMGEAHEKRYYVEARRIR
jgi:hypothetical protein